MFLVISLHFVYKFSICLRLPGRKQHTPRFALLGQSNNLHKNIAKSSIKKRRVKRGRTKHTAVTWERGREDSIECYTEQEQSTTEHNKRWLRKCANGKVKVQRTTYTPIHSYTHSHTLSHTCRQITSTNNMHTTRQQEEKSTKTANRQGTFLVARCSAKRKSIESS